MEYAMVAVAAAPVRRKPRHQREMTNQLLFGETVKILKEKDRLWVRVRSLHDNYEGWITRNLLEEVSRAQAVQVASHLTVGLLNTISVDGANLSLPLGASLPGFSDGKGKIGNREYVFDGAYTESSRNQVSGDLVQQLAMQWLNAPYLWGGRTIFGVDCSGFVQTNFRIAGINLARDAWQQAQGGQAVRKLKDAIKGDLAFFDDKEEIVHVGLLLNNEEIIHASGRVRIDMIDKKGIFNRETNQYSHRLKAIRRYF